MMRSFNAEPPRRLGSDPTSVRRRVEALEKVMERMIVVPGVNRPVGLDVILDLVPLVGPTAAAALGAYMAWEARNLGMPKSAVARMAGNVGVDWMLGLIPWVGAIIALATLGSAIRRKGLVRGSVDSALNAIPFVGGMKGMAEMARGRDFIADRTLPRSLPR
jgi:hypothetical protein